MNKKNIDKTSKWISELGELVPIKYNKKAHRTKLNKSNKDIEDYVRKPYGEWEEENSINIPLKKIDLTYWEIDIPKGTNQIQIKEINENED